MSKLPKLHKAQSGQAILFVVFAISLGLLALVSVSDRITSSISRTAQTDSYQKAQAVAEGAAENYLAKSQSDLDALVASCNPTALYTADGFTANIPASCVLGLSESRAVVGVETFPATTESLTLKADPSEMLHVKIDEMAAGSVIDVCWTGSGYADSYYFVYGGTPATGHTLTKAMYKCNAGSGSWCSIGSLTYSTNASSTATVSGTSSCYTVTVPTEPIALRLFTIPNSALYTISKKTGSNLQSQGYRITSVGEVTGTTGGSLDPKKAARKKVVVEKTFPYPSGAWYDFAITSVEDVVSSQ